MHAAMRRCRGPARRLLSIRTRPLDSTPTGPATDGFRRTTVKQERRLKERKADVLERRRERETTDADLALLAEVQEAARLRPLVELLGVERSPFLDGLLRLAASPRTRAKFSAVKMLAALPLSDPAHAAALAAAARRAAADDAEGLAAALESAHAVHTSKGFSLDSCRALHAASAAALPPGELATAVELRLKAMVDAAHR